MTHDPLLLTKPLGPENIVVEKDSFLLGNVVHRATALAGCENLGFSA